MESSILEKWNYARCYSIAVQGLVFFISILVAKAIAKAKVIKTLHVNYWVKYETHEEYELLVIPNCLKNASYLNKILRTTPLFLILDLSERICYIPTTLLEIAKPEFNFCIVWNVFNMPQ